MQRLRAAQNSGERLNRDTRDIIQRLLNCQRNSGGLRVKTHLHRARIFRAETLFHRFRPDDARGAIFGLTRNTGRAELARATLESVAFQTHDLVAAMKNDWTDHAESSRIRVDGGMAASDWTMQRVADIIGLPVERPSLVETTALGVAWLAGSHSGVWPDATEFGNAWACKGIFTPSLSEESREAKIRGWHDAVSRTLSRPMGRHIG